MWKERARTYTHTVRERERHRGKIHNFYYQKRGDKANKAYTRYNSDNNKESKEKVETKMCGKEEESRGK